MTRPLAVAALLTLALAVAGCRATEPAPTPGADAPEVSLEDLPSLRLERRFAVAPETVFDTLTVPELMVVWWGPGVTFDLDVREGGAWTIVREAGGREYLATGEYLEVQRPNRLRYTYSMPQFSPNSDTITVDIRADGDGSVLVFEHAGVDIASELSELAPGLISQSEMGWEMGFDLMEAAWGGEG